MFDCTKQGSLRWYLLYWLKFEPENFARWLNKVMFDSSVGECQLCGRFPCPDGSCKECILTALDEPISEYNLGAGVVD